MENTSGIELKGRKKEYKQMDEEQRGLVSCFVRDMLSPGCRFSSLEHKAGEESRTNVERKNAGDILYFVSLVASPLSLQQVGQWIG